MKRDGEILVSGDYMPIPKATLASHLLTPGEKLVFMCLINHLGQNDISWPGPAVISEECSLSVSAIKAALRRLVKLQMLTVTKRGAANANAYSVISTTPIVDGLNNDRSNSSRSENNLSAGQKKTGQQVKIKPTDRSKSDHELLNITTKQTTEETTEGVALPECLRTDAFREAWKEWETHRRQIKKKLTPLAAQKQLAMLAQLGETQAIHEIERAISGGWQGLYPEKKASLKNDDDSTFDSLPLRRKITIEDEYRAALQFPRPTPEFMAEHPEIYRNGKTLEQTQAFWDKADAWRKAGGDANSNRSMKNDYRKPFIHKGKLVEPDLEVPTL